MAESPAGQRVRIRQHLGQYPLLTVYEIARALGLTVTVVRRRLNAMEGDGELARVVAAKTPGTSTAVTRWKAT